jgi:hypothetical protein
MQLTMMELNRLFNDDVENNDDFFETQIYYQGYCYDDAYRIKETHHFVDDKSYVKNYISLCSLVYAFIERIEQLKSENYRNIITKENIHTIDHKYDSQAYSSYQLEYSRNLDIDYWCNDNNENIGQSATINKGKIKYSDLNLTCPHIKRRIDKFRWDMVIGQKDK